MQNSVTEERWRYIGGSDIPAILGISPFKSRFDLLLEKARLKENDFTGNAYTVYGQNMEGKIRDYINTIFGTFVEGKHVFEGETIGVRCHTDGETDDTILEVKTTSQIEEDIWGYDVYLSQTLYYMEKTEKPNGILAVYERPEDLSEEFDPKRLHVYKFNINDDPRYKDFIRRIDNAVETFIKDLVRLEENPFLTEEDFLPLEVKKVSGDLLVLEREIADLKLAEKKAEKLKEQLKVLMDEYGIKTWKTPNNYTITRVADVQDSVSVKETFNVETFKADHPRLYKKYIEEISSVKKGKKGYVKITAPKGE